MEVKIITLELFILLLINFLTGRQIYGLLQYKPVVHGTMGCGQKSWQRHQLCHAVHGAMGCGKKKLLVSVAVPPAHVRVPSLRPLALSVATVMSVANDKGDNEMILGAVHRSPGIYITTEENLRKSQLGDRHQIAPLLDVVAISYNSFFHTQSHDPAQSPKKMSK